MKWDHWLQDVRLAVRSLVKTPAFTGVAVLTLAVGVGANAAIFSLLQGVVLRDLPYRDAERLESPARGMGASRALPDRTRDHGSQLEGGLDG